MFERGGRRAAWEVCAAELVAAEHGSALSYLAQCDAICVLYDSTGVFEPQVFGAAGSGAAGSGAAGSGAAGSGAAGRVPEAEVSRHDHALEEAGALLHLHPLSVGERLGTGWFLQAHPLLRALLVSGGLGVAHLQVTVTEVSVLDDTALADTVLRDDLPSPPPPTDASQPTAAQTRLVRARDCKCSFPGCHRQARRAELDHRLRHPDGPTAVSNLHPLCKHHHRLKHDGWSCHRDPDGTTRWTSPRGHRYTNNPP